MMDQRLQTSQNIWLASVRPDGRPHLVPIWFVYLADHLYICTDSKSVKARNITRSPHVSFALEDGNKPLIGEGQATVLEQPYPEDVIAAFKAKFGWDITTDVTYNTLIQITPVKWLNW